MKWKEIVSRLRTVVPVVEVTEVEVLNQRLHELHARMGEVLS